MGEAVLIRLAIPHTPWVPERVASFERLMQALEPFPERGKIEFRIFSEKAPNDVWSVEMWGWLARPSETDDEIWCLQLQDDAIVTPNFWAHLDNIIASVCKRDFGVDAIFGLHAVHPLIKAAHTHLKAEWCTTSDGLVGVGYAMHVKTLRNFLSWRGANIGAVRGITEDTLLGLYAAVCLVPIVHPVPTIVTHDTSLASTYGNDTHGNRVSPVMLSSDKHEWPQPNAETMVHLGALYADTPYKLRKMFPELSVASVNALLRDSSSRPAMRRISQAMQGRKEVPYRVLVCTPSRGSVSTHYAASIANLLNQPGFTLDDIHQDAADVVRTRSRMVHRFLHLTDATHLLFLDSDIEVRPECIEGMLRAKKEFIVAPYPRRAEVHFDTARQAQDAGLPPEAGAYRYNLKPLDGKLSFDGNAVCEIEMAPLGCALIARAPLQALEFMSSELVFEDDIPWGNGVTHPTAALFQLLLTPDKKLLSEDYSFCTRWRQAGLQIHAYLGLGSPASHVGDHVFKGCIEAFGLTRTSRKESK